MTGPLPPDTHAEDISERIVAAVLAIPGVAAMHGGAFGEVATYLPGRRVTGVTVGPTSCAVHLAARYPANVVDTAERVRAAVESLVDVPVDVTIEDLLTETGQSQ
ncbi:hypothetical protein [Rhodococcus sp. IEGM 1307]|uniref:hypothetical protein n=1 Tax=Rhodococcus sp. IEGM 1307 TaxID=3047091 RepID=UPI0024B70034|nr:hypothetical protein [Rhodococcus sp. IEGM 1307]MDI9972887.1 hypothetical protein [Rhodococcus sp. IEGM 1307]